MLIRGKKAQLWLHTYAGQQKFDFNDRKSKELEETERVVDNMNAVLINGTQLLLDQVYDCIGFDRIPDEILRHLVIARVSQPGSKLAAVDYLKSYYDKDVDLNHIYRYMDMLYNTQMELAQQISVEHLLDAAKTITTIRIKMPENGTCFTKTLFLTEKHLAIRTLFREGDNEMLLG